MNLHYPEKTSHRYITTPIYYVNDAPHIGHVYTSMAADMMARFYRMAGYKTFFLTGTDEHGGKVETMALSLGRTPQNHVDIMSQVFRELAKKANISHDDFIRTSEERHKKAAQHLWEDLEQKGFIYEGVYEGWYAQRDEAFYDEKELLSGLQGEKLAPTGAPVSWLQEPCYFFALSQFREKLLDFYKKNPHSIGPKSRYNEVVSFLKGELKDLAISRSRLTWGIPLPQGKKGSSSGHVMYVWIDALTNYLTALGYPEKKDSKDFQEFWSQSCHLIGKDILRFHSVYWPAFLMGIDLPPPHRVFAHGWWTRDGQKMSKSLGNGLDPINLMDTYGVDPLRYFLLSHITFGADGDFSHGLFVQKCNEGLSDSLGNLLQRVLGFIVNKMGGSLDKNLLSKDPPKEQFLGESHKNLWEALEEFANKGQKILKAMENFIENQELDKYISHLMSWVHEGNILVNHLAPWVLLKDIQSQEDKNSENTTPEFLQEKRDKKNLLHKGLWALLQGLRDIALYFHPIGPQSALNMIYQITGEHLTSQELTFDTLGQSLEWIFPLKSPTPVFQRLSLKEEKGS